MSQENYFNNINDLDSGIKRVLGDGISTRIFCGDQSMLSIVTIEPNAKGQIHSHPQEQWGFLIEGSGIRIQGGQEIEIKKGDFWQTSGASDNCIIGGPEAAKVLDIISTTSDE
mgnify:CR=1 FL=1